MFELSPEISRRSRVFWLIVGIVVVTGILAPYAVYHESVDAWAARILRQDQGRPVVAVVVVLLLIGDVFLPIPSSFVGTAAGSVLGFTGGLLAVWIGMTMGCVAAYAMGRLTSRAAPADGSPKEQERMTATHERLGDWMLAVFRPVPVLAEASVFFAGAVGVPLPRFLLITGGANLGISAVYAGAGAFAGGRDSFLIAFLFAMLVPGALMLVAGVWKRREV